MGNTYISLEQAARKLDVLPWEVVVGGPPAGAGRARAVEPVGGLK